ncbi:hypothetical protein [Glycomyces albidus]|uniref:Uncharacterized protein n=1 Tax=Glycomyces albidus TaxID=2656774 RepID=A0A6L5GA39_9ACTN|nr:hypothetical protein [Glycomyces albidus]MQM26413.1 hypothetical protein [Glycomyces albidus]
MALEVLDRGVAAVLGDQVLGCRALGPVVEGGEDRFSEGGAGEQAHRGGAVELPYGVGDLVDPRPPGGGGSGEDRELPGEAGDGGDVGGGAVVEVEGGDEPVPQG